MNKRENGVYLTEKNPFQYIIFKEWLEGISPSNLSICEPYAGSNNLLLFLDELLLDKEIQYTAFDLNPQDNNFPKVEIQQADTMFNIPGTYDLIITNPPYLAKNSATRRKLFFPIDYMGKGLQQPQDLYQICLDTCLDSALYVGAIIPESFITSKYNKDRLQYVISLPGNLFKDTECPVCLALFGPNKTDDFILFDKDGVELGSYNDLISISNQLLAEKKGKITFNDPSGILGLKGVDDTNGPSIEFCLGKLIPSEKIKPSSRSLTRISSKQINSLSEEKLLEFIDILNLNLKEWRNKTNDIFLTAFKGVRADGKYRRRLAFNEANLLINKVLQKEKENIDTSQ